MTEAELDSFFKIAVLFDIIAVVGPKSSLNTILGSVLINIFNLKCLTKQENEIVGRESYQFFLCQLQNLSSAKPTGLYQRTVLSVAGKYG